MSRFTSFNIFPYQWSFKDEDTNRGLQTIIRCYGWNEKNESVYIRIEDPIIPLFVELSNQYEWDDNMITTACNSMYAMIYRKDMKPVSICAEWKHKSYYAHVVKNMDKNSTFKYSMKKFPFLMVSFPSMKARDNFVIMLRKEINVPGMGKLKFKTHTFGQTITPVYDLLAMKHLPPASWIKCKGIRLTGTETESTRKHEYAISYKDMKAMSEEEVLKMPIVLPTVMSFDNEMNSTFISSMPKAKRPGDKTFQIGYVVMKPPKDGKPKYYKKVLISLGNPDPIDDVIVKKCKTEADVMIQLSKDMVEEDPEVVIGFNIFKWDIPYMIERCKDMCHCLSEFDVMGCLEGHHAQEETIRWSSSAYGKQDYLFLNAEGRLFIDMLPFVQKNYKLPNYRLETICEEFLKTNKDPLKPKDIFRCYRTFSPSSLALVGKYCVQDAYVTLLLYEKLQTWFTLTESAVVNCVPIFDMLARGQQIKLFAALYRYGFEHNIVIESNGFIADDKYKFQGAFVSEPIKGLYDMVVPLDFCVDGDALITLANGSSKRLKDFQDDSTTLLISCDEKNMLQYDTAFPLVPKGKKETVKVWCFDGSTIITTPDHEFLTTEGWVEAKDLKDKEVISGITFPENPKEADEEKWFLKIDSLELDLDKNREKTLAFCRIIGYLLSDGSIYLSKKKDKETACAEASFGTQYDADMFVYDLGMFCNKLPNVRKRIPIAGTDRSVKGTTFNVSIPGKFAKIIHAIPGIVIGKRSTQGMSLPAFLLEDNVPVCLIREFLSGLYGGDGTAPSLSKRGSFTTINFKWTTIEKYKSNMQKVFESLKRMHEKLGIEVGPVKTLKVKYGEKAIKPKDLEENPRWNYTLRMTLESISIFSKYVGFKYCLNKMARCHIVALYLTMCQKTREQHAQVVNKSIQLIEEKIPNTLTRIKGAPTFQSCLDEVQKQVFADEPPLSSYSFSSTSDLHDERSGMKRRADKPRKRRAKCIMKVEDFLNKLGVKKWFDDYVIQRDDEKFPSMKKSIIAVLPHKEIDVYDIEVSENNNFVANGFVVHNCSLYPSLMMAYNIDHSKLVLDEKIPDEDCHVMVWSEHEYCKCPKDTKPGKKPKKLKDGSDKKVCAEYKFRWLKAEVGGEGVIPILLKRVLGARKKAKAIIKVNEGEIGFLKKLITGEPFTDENREYLEKRMKTFTETKENIPALEIVREKGEKGEYTKEEKIKLAKRIEQLEEINQVLSQREKAYKVNANSMYGACGAKKGYVPFLPAAMCVTFMGRTNILKVNDFIHNVKGGKVIYNDTDSAYCFFPEFKDKPAHELWAHAKQIVQEIKSIFPPPLSLEFEEKIYKKFLILTKKRYVAQSMNEEGKIDSKLMKRGIVLQRRDNCKVLRTVYQDLVLKVFEHHEELVKLKEEKDQKVIMQNKIVNELLNMIIFAIDSMFQWKYGFRDFVITKQVTKEVKEYKNPNRLPSHVLLSVKMKNRGVPVGPGSRIEYLILKHKSFKKTDTQKDKIEDVNYFAEFREVFRLSYLDYLKQFINPIDEICSVVMNVDKFVKQQFDQRIKYSKVVERIKELGRPNLSFVD